MMQARLYLRVRDISIGGVETAKARRGDVGRGARGATSEAVGDGRGPRSRDGAGGGGRGATAQHGWANGKCW